MNILFLKYSQQLHSVKLQSLNLLLQTAKTLNRHQVIVPSSVPKVPS